MQAGQEKQVGHGEITRIDVLPDEALDVEMVEALPLLECLNQVQQRPCPEHDQADGLGAPLPDDPVAFEKLRNALALDKLADEENVLRREARLEGGERILVCCEAPRFLAYEVVVDGVERPEERRMAVSTYERLQILVRLGPRIHESTRVPGERNSLPPAKKARAPGSLGGLGTFHPDDVFLTRQQFVDEGLDRREGISGADDDVRALSKHAD